MEFTLTKLLGGLMMPVPIIFFLLACGILLSLLSRFRVLATLLTASGTVLLILVSTPPFPEKILRDLEKSYPVLEDIPQVPWIIVLGGGTRGKDHWPAASRLGEASMYRLAEGVRLARILPDATLITSGGSDKAGPSSAELMAAVAVSWGIDPGRIIISPKPHNTAQEAREAASIINQHDSLLLVTSASHMPRAVALFQGQGLSVIPSPTGHLVDPQRSQGHVGTYLPQSAYIRFVERAMWERIGLFWARLRGLL